MTPLWLWAGVCLAQSMTGAVSGVVFDAEGAPISGVVVSVGGGQAVTDGDGVWRLDVDPGTVMVDLRAPGQPPVQVPAVAVVAGMTTELLISLGEGLPAISLEAPAQERSRQPVELGPPGAVAGSVRGDGGALGGVRLFVRGLAVDATSGKDGSFTLSLPAGSWEVTAVRAGYGTRSATVDVVAHEQVALSLVLEKTGLQLGDLTITAPRITGGTASVLDERRESSSVSDVLGAEQMSKSGDGDAAAALRRVTGLTVIDGKYVYVRGLGDRYSATLLNGSSLPSPEPEKRVVPLDLFPTALIESIVIQKTFSPDRPGEFGGGVVEVKTRGIPEKPVFQIGLSGTWVAGSTFTEATVAPTGPTDWLGYGTGWRDLPPAVAAASDDEALKSGGIFSDGGYSAEELAEFGELIPNRWGHETRTLPPDFGLNISAGRRWNLLGAEVGASTGLVYSNSWDVDEGVRTVYAAGADGLNISRQTTFLDTSNKVRAGGALSLGVAWEDLLSITSTTLINRASKSTALFYDADDPTGSNDTHNERNSWEEMQLAFEQIAVDLQVWQLELEGRAAFALATRLEPDRREWTYLVTDEGLALSQRGSWNDMQFLTLDDHTRDLGADVTLDLPEVGHDTKFKVGAGEVDRNRSSTIRRFSYTFKGTEGIDLSAPIEDVIVAENIGAEEAGDPGYLEIEENTVNSDDYTASQQLRSAYAMADAAWTPRVRTLVGARVERSIQTVSTFELFDTSRAPVGAKLESTDLLPAATVSVGIGGADDPDSMLLRAGYGKTLSRPEFRELSEVAHYDYKTGRTLFGNPDLERATIDNVDLRWEWYPRAGESLSAGVFFKYFDHPIESVVAVSAVSGSLGTFDNATSATNFGTEIDVRQRLDRIAPALENFIVSANVSLIASRVDLSDTSGNQTSSERPLQGQSPWVANTQLSYEDPDRKTTVALLYNAFGPRIVDVGTSGIPDTYEQPVHRVDAVWTQGLSRGFQLRLKATNLLDWPSRQTVAENVTEETRSGRAVGVSASWGI